MANDVQKRVIDLLDRAEPKENLKKWVRGYIPKHYKRITIDEDEQARLAKIGATKVGAYFGKRLYFTQSVIVGAMLDDKYNTISIIAPTQYGKSFSVGHGGVLMANEGKRVNIAAGNDDKTKIIMREVIKAFQSADNEILSKLNQPADKIEKMMTSASKSSQAFTNGGSIDTRSLGDTKKDKLSSNEAVGIGGNYIIDEADLISDDAMIEVGRREFSNVDGKKEMLLMISNPHKKNDFYKTMLSTNIAEDELIIWMDIRTSLEEGRVPSKEYVTSTKMFKKNDTCIRYLLCEANDTSESSMFGDIQVIDEDEDISDYRFYMGVDCASKGQDDIKVAICGVNSKEERRVIECITINKDNWITGQSEDRITADIAKLAVAYKVNLICIDVGEGIWLAGRLVKALPKIKVIDINFGSRTTEERRKRNHYSAEYGSNMRAELHLDLQDFIEEGMIKVSEEIKEELQRQLNAVTYDYKTNGKIQIRSKDEIKVILGKSPDDLDAIMLSVHASILDNIKSNRSLVYT